MAGKFEPVASAMMTTTYRLDLPFGRLGRRGALDEDRDDSGCVDVNENAGRSAPVTCRLLERPVPHEACGAVQTWPASLEVFAAQPQLRIGLSLLPFRKVDLLSYSSAHFCEACVTAFWKSDKRAAEIRGSPQRTEFASSALCNSFWTSWRFNI